jgi:hypothetical protein
MAEAGNKGSLNTNVDSSLKDPNLETQYYTEKKNFILPFEMNLHLRVGLL